MKVVVVGTRGIPDIQGGVETHCAGLYPELVSLGIDVTILRRRHYAEASESSRGLKEWNGIRLIDLYAPRLKSFEAIVHTFLGILKARALKPDIVHIHAIGPSIVAPFARLLGMKVVMTNHGPDYHREKWGPIARTFLRLGERFGSKASNRVIAISPVIASDVGKKYGCNPVVIPNGVNPPHIPHDAENIIATYGLKPRRYILALGRFVPEKGFDTLIEAYSILRKAGRIDPDIKLVIAGDADHETPYARSLRAKATASPGIVLTGFISGDNLKALTAMAALFAMPSTHEGLPIALLEAMSYGIDVATSNISSCRLPELSEQDSVPPGNPDFLASLMASKLSCPATPRHYDLSRYSWPSIASDTLAVYRSITDN
ncbi:MAG: glycosyltransferase family 4 protein [Bacteroides sp.]|nr:glycosyltransferase family 4 protein [Bacteroides sp.]